MATKMLTIERAVDESPGYQDPSTPRNPQKVLVITGQGLSDVIHRKGVRRVYEALKDREETFITSPGDYALIQKALMGIVERNRDSKMYAKLLLDTVRVVEPGSNLITSIEDAISGDEQKYRLRAEVIEAIRTRDEELTTRHAGRIRTLVTEYFDDKEHKRLKKPKGIREETFLEYAERRLNPDKNPNRDLATRLGAAVLKALDGASVFVRDLRDTDRAKFQAWLGTFYPDVRDRIECDVKIQSAYA
jgi:hypothetical protein